MNGSSNQRRYFAAERKLLKELEYQATHDSLTKIANRHMFEQYLHDLVDSSIEQNTKHALCFIDLDKFKIVNDTCGHPAGDKLLIQVADGIQKVISENDTLARLGGDEFGLLIRNCPEKESEAVAQRVYEFFNTSYFQQDEHVFPIRASIGFVQIDGQFPSVDSVMEAADLACYYAKENGRNTLYKYNSEVTEHIESDGNSQLMPKLLGALENDYFSLALQPVCPLYKSEVEFEKKYEILLRYQGASGQQSSSAQLLGAAKRYNMMLAVDRWVIRNSFEAISEYRLKTGDESALFSINLSSESLNDDKLFDYIVEQLRTYNLAADKLCFEASEAEVVAALIPVKTLFGQLQSLGCRVVLDDFGAGINAFGFLMSLPLDYLKIDGHIVRSLHTNMIHREIVRCTLAVARQLGVTVIAENVENQQVLDELTTLGIRYAQGYHLSRPHPMAQLLEPASDQNLKAA